MKNFEQISNSSPEGKSTEWDALTELANQQEAEKPQLDPESLKSVNKLQDQLEQMGVDERIIANPAFRRNLSKIVDTYGLTMADDVEIKSAEEHSLTLGCASSRGDARRHDVSHFNFSVSEDGHLEITAACSDIDRTQRPKSQFPTVTVRDDVDMLNCIDSTNIAARINFSLVHDSGNLLMTTNKVYENQLIPLNINGATFNAGQYQAFHSKETRDFDAAGKEQFREYLSHDPTEYRSIILKNYSPNDHTKASTVNLNGFRDGKLKGITHSERYSRNIDGTIKVAINDSHKGTITQESWPMNTQHGDDDLIPSNGLLQYTSEETDQGH